MGHPCFLPGDAFQSGEKAMVLVLVALCGWATLLISVGPGQSCAPQRLQRSFVGSRSLGLATPLPQDDNRFLGS
jgi:hypothetical protein